MTQTHYSPFSCV